MAKPLFGVETEYAVAGIRRDGAAGSPSSVVRSLMLAARRKLVHLCEGCGADGMFLANGSRFYVDAGLHPELATAECVDPWQAVRYIEAGHRILASLVASLPDGRSSGSEIVCLRNNVDLSGGETTWACHESYLHTRPACELRTQLIPHLVTRIVYTGAGGFNPFSPGLEFTLAPRMAFFDSVVSDSSTGDRGIWHTKSEPLCSGYGRLHVLCGESLCSQTANFLKLGVTALVLAMADAGLEPGKSVRLADAVEALRTVAGDVTCKSKLRIVGGGQLTPVEVQRHYLTLAESHLRDDFMPSWAPAVCRHWRAVLDLLDNAPASVAQTLDWGIKYALYTQHARKLSLPWNALPILNETIPRLPADLLCPSGAGDQGQDSLPFMVPDHESQISAHPYKSSDEVEAALRVHNLRLADLSAVLHSRPQFFELETRFSQLGAKGIFQALEAANALHHRVDGVGDIDAAMTDPPVGSRAFLRGQAIRRLNGNRNARSSWQQVVDLSEHKFLDLSDPFAQTESWQPMPSDPDPDPAAIPSFHFMREGALDAYLSGDYPMAEELLRDCLAGDFEPQSTHAHLARVLLLMDREEEARDQIVRAWGVPQLAPPRQIVRARRALRLAPAYVIGRMLFFECLFAMLDHQSISTPVGRLRDLLIESPAHLEWTIQPMLHHLHPRLAEEDYNFLSALAEALSDRRALPRLNDLPQWRDTEPDRGWYSRYIDETLAGTPSGAEIATQDSSQAADPQPIDSHDIPF